MVLYFFPDYGSLRVVLLNPLMMDRLSHTIEQPLLTESKHMIVWLNLTPCIIPFPLNTCRVGCMWPNILLCKLWLFLHCSSLWIKKVFGAQILTTWNSKLKPVLLCLRWKLMASYIAFSKWLPNMRWVVLLLDIVELISQTIKILCLDDLLNLFIFVGLDSICLIEINLVPYIFH